MIRPRGEGRCAVTPPRAAAGRAAFWVWLTAAAAGCGSNTPVAPSTTGSPTTDSLRQAGTAAGRLLGTAVQSGFLNDTRYASVLTREFDYVTAEYQMKWNVVEPSPGVDRFDAGDAIVGFAQASGMQIKGHTLIWHGSVPDWVNSLAADALRAAFERHIRTEVEHYRGRILVWDVVNEAVADAGAGLRNTIFRERLGDTYIADAFRLAHDADPQALLFYNDYGGEGLNAKSDRIYDLVSTLRAQGVPIDGVGLQMHVSAASPPSDPDIAANMRRLAALGLLVTISEMDVRINSYPGTTEMRLAAQKNVYHSIVSLCVAEPRCQAVTFWGFTDAHTSSAGDSPLLFDAAYTPKPAYDGVLDALRRR